jgi:hypothetical protein
MEARVKILDIVIRSRLSSISTSHAPLAMEASESTITENGIASDVDLFAVASKLDNYRASDIHETQILAVFSH